MTSLSGKEKSRCQKQGHLETKGGGNRGRKKRSVGFDVLWRKKKRCGAKRGREKNQGDSTQVLWRVPGAKNCRVRGFLSCGENAG